MHVLCCEHHFPPALELVLSSPHPQSLRHSRLLVSSSLTFFEDALCLLTQDGPFSHLGVGSGNHSATERPWLSYFAPKLQNALNELAAATAKTSEEGRGDQYEVQVSSEDREPLEVV